MVKQKEKLKEKLPILFKVADESTQRDFKCYCKILIKCIIMKVSIIESVILYMDKNLVILF